MAKTAENKLRWMRLDNAAKIYPAARRQNWSNLFRLSATLTSEVDTAVLQSALEVTVRRFPSIAARLRRGVFWYYIQQLPSPPVIREEYISPVIAMNRNEARKCALRVIVYKRRIAVEFFHSLTDGNGGLVFLKTLLAEYIQQKEGIAVPATCGVLSREETPSEAELEDSFQKYAGPIAASRQETNAWRLKGTPTLGGLLHLTCFKIPVKAALDAAHAHGVSMTVFLCATIMMALQNMQCEEIAKQRKRKPIKVLVPVNLRNLFESKTLRNFALYTTPEIDPRLGEYDFEEICRIVKHHLGATVTKKQMAMRIATNVGDERMLAVKLMPLFIKNAVMKAIFNAAGEKKSCLCISNLGAVDIPDEMRPFIERFDFILSAQATAPHNCSAVAFGDTLYVNCVRDIEESRFEYHLFRVWQTCGLPVEVESNQLEK